jgi:hypothetical protein
MHITVRENDGSDDEIFTHKNPVNADTAFQRGILEK